MTPTTFIVGIPANDPDYYAEVCVMSDVLKYRFRVTIEREIEVDLPAHFASDEYLKDFREGLWYVEGVDDVAKYAAHMAADIGSGYNHDGLGLLSDSDFPKPPDVRFREVESDMESELLEKPKITA